MEIDYTHVAQCAAEAEGAVRRTRREPDLSGVHREGRRRQPAQASGGQRAVWGDNTIFRREINLGMAVALDWGLIVPVIRRADELNLLGLARANDLAERARTKKLGPDDVQKGTFTITNPGVFGTLVGTPIINQPQVAILGSARSRSGLP
jgi:hypothetical protein